MRILIAEDEPITRRVLQRQLESWGHNVVTAEDGTQAWDQLQQQQFDVVVTDWEMPGLDGRELIRRVRGQNPDSYTYLIMVTARSDTEDLVAGMEAGADDFLKKPFDSNELRVRLHAGERIIHLERKLAAQNKVLSRVNERMAHDLDAAAKLQQSLLPSDLPASPGVHFAWHFEPCDELAGDIFNVLQLDERHYALYLLDVTDHGVAAALLAVTLSQLLTTRDLRSSFLVTQDNSNGARIVTPPGEVAERLNRRFPMETQGGHYFTMIYAVLDAETGFLRYANAGHPLPILLRRDCSPQQLPGGSLPIGMFPQAEFGEGFLQLEPGDRVYLYSDGMTDVVNSRNEMLEMNGFVQLIERHRSSPLDVGVAACVDSLKRWCESMPLADDVSLLAFEWSS